MNKVCILFAFLFIYQGLCLWPLPVNVGLGSQTVIISPTQTTFKSNITSGILSRAITRYNGLLYPFSHSFSSSALSVNVNINVASASETLSFGVSENYTLTASASGSSVTVLLTSSTIWGALRGLETFSQLISWNETSQLYYMYSLPLNILDYPRFPWRGFLIDSARHYLPKSAILHMLDALAYNKFNVLHWHTIDAQSFPIYSTKYPNLAKGAYSPRAIFTSSDVQQIVSYGLDRGIRVLPEFDMPGHAASWGVGYPQITVTQCSKYTANINNIPLNPTLNETYDVVNGFLTEMAQWFPDEMMHIGGDEIVFGCWMEVPSITTWMAQHGMNSAAQLYSYFENKIAVDLLQRTLRKTPVVWEEVFDYGAMPNKQVIVEVWRNTATLQNVISAGYQAILAAGYYLDQQIPNNKATWYEWEDTWRNFYENDPLSVLFKQWKEEGFGADQSLVLGGEAAMWGEQVDETNIDSRVWPRASATAERLWSQESVNSASAAVGRLAQFRCNSLARRGIGAGPVQPDWCPLPSFFE